MNGIRFVTVARAVVLTAIMCVLTSDAVAFVPSLNSQRRSTTTLDGPAPRYAPNPLRLVQFGVVIANACCTPYAPCPLAQPMQIGSPCVCYSVYGPITGYACRR